MLYNIVGNNYERFQNVKGNIFTDGVDFYYANPNSFIKGEPNVVELRPELFGVRLPEFAARVIRENLDKIAQEKSV